MPRILKLRKKPFLVCMALLAVILIITPLWYVSLLLVACIAFICLNQIVVNKNRRAYNIAFTSKRDIRQWDTLVIGSLPPPLGLENAMDIVKERTLLLLSPGRSLKASCQILLHAGSLLNNNGKVIILNDGRHGKSKAYTIFDIPYLGLIARKQLGLEPQLRKVPYPLLFEPIRSLKLLLGIGSRNYIQTECPDEEIVSYCKRKGFSLTYMEKS